MLGERIGGIANSRGADRGGEKGQLNVKILYRRAAAHGATLCATLALLVGSPATEPVPAAEPNADSAAPSDTKKSTPAPPVIAARVADVPIYVAEVDAALHELLGERDITAARRNRLRAEMLRQTVEERVALHYLRRHKRAASSHQINAEVKHITAQLKSRQTTLADHVSSRGITEQALREELHWRLSWQRYLQKTITDETQAKYFADHRRDFDGTRMRTSQILLVPDDSNDVETLRKQLRELRQKIESSDLSFVEAARQYSAAPSKSTGGDLGFLTRHGEMHPALSAAAFALEEGELSDPIVTPHGVHLLKCTAIEPGERTWQDARDELRQAMIRAAFRKIVEQERPQVSVRYSGAMPYLDPKNGQLVVPRSAAE